MQPRIGKLVFKLPIPKPSTLALSVGAILVVRALFLWRFGDCPNWMGFSYLEHARALALGEVGGLESPLLTPSLIVFFRALGLSGVAAIGAVYLLAHGAFAYGTLSLARSLWGPSPERRLAILAGLVAMTPLLSGVWGHGNVGALMGASLSVLGLALAAAIALDAAPSRWRLVLAGLVVFLAANARFEAVATCAVGALAFHALGRRLEGFPSHSKATRVLLLGVVLGYGTGAILRSALADGGTTANYGFYTFYDGLPFLMWPEIFEHGDEYGRYLASRELFGSYAEHGGSVLGALASNPGAALLRFLAKIPELFGSLSWIECLTPLGIAAALVGLRGLRRRSDEGSPRCLSPSWLLLAYVGPLCLLFVPPPSPPYLLAILPPLLFAMARGIERATTTLAPRFARGLAGSALALGLVYVAFFARHEVASSPVLDEAAEYLERRCAGGCLVNVLPQALRVQTFVRLDAGAKLPRREGRSEPFITGEGQGAYRRAFRFDGRIERARAAGFSGPVLYVKTDIASTRVFHPVFDPEPRYEGRVDLSGARLEKVLERGADRVLVYELPGADGPKGAAVARAR